MKNFYSCAELAELKISGLPASKPGVKIRAESEGWIKREVTAKGGKGGVKTEYQPPKAILEIIKHQQLGTAISDVNETLTISTKKTDLTIATKQLPTQVAYSDDL